MRTEQALRTFIVFLGLILAMAACESDGSGGGGGGGGDASAADTTADGAGGDALAEDAGVDTAPTPSEPEDYRVVYGYQGRITGENTEQFDLWVVAPDGSSPVNLTQASLSALGHTCEFGCVVDQALGWIAVSVAPADQGQFTFRVGQISPDLTVHLHKSGSIEDVIDLKFAGHHLFYSQRVGCKDEGKNCQYAIHELNLDDLSTETLGVFPPDTDPDYAGGKSTYQGHFHVSPDAESVIVLSPTIASVRVYLIKGGLLSELDFICQDLSSGNCSGTGSWYTDRDPMAISHDSRHVLFFTKAEKDAVLRLYDTTNVTDKRFSFLMSVPTGSIKDNNIACANKAPWQFIDVAGIPRFTRDNQRVVLVGRSDCGDRPETNIYSMEVASIGDGSQFDASDLTALVDKPTGDTVDNVIIHELDPAPAGRFWVFSGTPTIQSNGQPVPAGSSRAKNDAEVYVLDPATGAFAQITNDVEYKVQGLFTIDGK